MLGRAEAFVDINLMMIVIRNLVNNAMKYSHEEGTVDVFLKKQDKKIEIYGEGLSPGDVRNRHKRIFDRFYRTDKARNSDGFGLGLAISERIVGKSTEEKSL